MIACAYVWPVVVVVVAAIISTGVVAYAAVTHVDTPEDPE